MQSILPRFDRTLLATTSALIGAASLLLAIPAHAAFDPNAGAGAYSPTAATTTHLPDTGVLSTDMPARPLYATGAAPAPGTNPTYVSPLEPIKMPRPLYPSRAATMAQPVTVPAEVRTTAPVAAPAAAPMTAAAPATIIAPAPVLAPVPAAMPKPMTAPAAPTPIIAATPTMPDMPPVDAATAARAQAIMAAEQKPVVLKPVAAPTPVEVAAMPEPTGSVSPNALPGTFIAPAPVLARSPAPASVPAPAVATAPVVAKPVVVATPVRPMPPAALPKPMPAPAVAAAPIPVPPPVGMASKPPVDDISPVVQPDLSSQSRAMLAGVPSGIDSPKVGKTTKVKLDRVSPEIQQVLGKGPEEENYESAGISIKVRRPGLDTNYELNSAYNSLMGGDTQRAITTYKNILSTEPRNEEALFGLAATYHRLGMETQARPYYAALLKINPNHREALNNFLVLVSGESPADALPELERLEIRNPDFSPIPAQIAIVYDKLGYPDQAREKMLRAIELAPENLTYKYNLAIMLDRQKHYADAVALYRLLINAAMNGEHVPASVESMERRLNYISTAATQGRLGS